MEMTAGPGLMAVPETEGACCRSKGRRMEPQPPAPAAGLIWPDGEFCEANTRFNFQRKAVFVDCNVAGTSTRFELFSQAGIKEKEAKGRRGTAGDRGIARHHMEARAAMVDGSPTCLSWPSSPQSYKSLLHLVSLSSSTHPLLVPLPPNIQGLQWPVVPLQLVVELVVMVRTRLFPVPPASLNSLLP